MTTEHTLGPWEYVATFHTPRRPEETELGHAIRERDEACVVSERLLRGERAADAEIARLRQRLQSLEEVEDALRLLVPTVGPYPADLRETIKGAVVTDEIGFTAYVHGDFYAIARAVLNKAKGGA